MKNLLALLLAVAMLLSLVPVSMAQEQELMTVTLLGTETLGLVSFEDAQKTESWKEFEKLAASYGIKLECTVVDREQYPTVLQAQIASGKLPDMFQAEVLSAADRTNLIESGLIRPINELLEYSNGTATWSYSEGWMKDAIANNTYVDGKIWYLCDMDHYVSIMADEYNMGIPLYQMLIRQDWLDRLNLPMPSTMDELFDTLVAFSENDMNGDGIKNERMVLDMRTVATLWGGFFDSGLSGWFGLANYPFQMNRGNGKVDIPYLQEGFADYIRFLKRCIDAGVLFMGDDIGKQDTVEASLIAENVISMYYGMTRVDTAGKPAEAIYSAIPAIQGSSAPVVTSNALFADLCYDQFGFSASGDVKAQAALLDMFCSREYGVWYYYGQEGITYVVDPDTGAWKDINPTSPADVVSGGYGKGRFFGYSGFLPNINIISYLDSYKGQPVQFASFDEFLASPYFNEYYLPLYPDKESRIRLAIDENLKYLNYLPNNDRSASLSICTLEQGEILDMYESELYTFMDELNANLFNGNWSLDHLPDYLAEMEGMGLYEVRDVYQQLFDVYNAGFGRTFE